jgi:hypothetical protein
MSRVRVTVDKLSLKGFEADQRRALVEGLQSELARILADPATRGAWARPWRASVLRLGQTVLEPGAPGSRRFGGGMARGIAREAMNNARDRR